jgi:hypothetical protein
MTKLYTTHLSTSAITLQKYVSWDNLTQNININDLNVRM